MRALTPPSKSYAEIKATRKMRWWYESLADLMIANPKMTQAELASHFGRTTVTISIITNTDAFKAYMRQRRNELQISLDQDVRSKLLRLTGDTLDVMIDKIDKKKDTLPIAELNRTAEMALKALGYTSDKPSVVVNNAPTQQTTVVVPVSLDDLQAAQAALRASQRQPTYVDVTPEPVREARQEGSEGSLSEAAE